MGRILGSRTTKEGNVIFDVEMDYLESLNLKGHIKNIHLFSEDVADIQASLSQRGKNEGTKYFLVPRDLRSGLKFNEKVKCQKIETDNKIIFIYVIDKISL